MSHLMIKLLNCKSVSHETWLTNRYNHWRVFLRNILHNFEDWFLNKDPLCDSCLGNFMSLFHFYTPWKKGAKLDITNKWVNIHIEEIEWGKKVIHTEESQCLSNLLIVIHSFFYKHSVFWFSFSMLMIFLISALYHA